MSGPQSAGLFPHVSRNRAREAFAAALMLYVGYRKQKRRFTMGQLSSGSGVPARVIESAMEEPDSAEYRNPPLYAVLCISRFLGAEFTSEWLKLADQGAFDLPEEDVPPGALAADNAEDNAVIARAAADGEFSDPEKPDLRIVGERLITRGQCLVAIGKAA